MAKIKEKESKRITNVPKSLSKSRAKPSEPTTMDELLAQTGYTIGGFRRGQEVTGTIISIRNSEIVVDIGGKSEGVVLGREFEHIRGMLSEFSVGQTITAVVTQTENDQGVTILSLRRMSGERRWTELAAKQEEDAELETTVIDSNRGGLVVDAHGVRGFVPASQLAERPVKLTDLIGKRLTVKIVELDRKGNRLVLSERQVRAKELAEKSKAVLERLTIGKRYQGTTTAVLPFGLFVDVEGVEGLVHVSEISWAKLPDVGALFKPGQTQEVLVIGKDPEAGKLHLSIKQLTEDPWVKVTRQYIIGQAVAGKVTKQTNFGVFVEIEPGVEGLIRSSSVPAEGLTQGSTVTCIIESLKGQKRRMSLRLSG